MIKIIENPNPVKEEIMTCENCKCKFSYTEGDIHIESWSNGILGPGCYGYTKKTIQCPNCGKIININFEDTDSYKKELEFELEGIFPHLNSDEED